MTITLVIIFLIVDFLCHVCLDIWKQEKLNKPEFYYFSGNKKYRGDDDCHDTWKSYISRNISFLLDIYRYKKEYPIILAASLLLKGNDRPNLENISKKISQLLNKKEKEVLFESNQEKLDFINVMLSKDSSNPPLLMILSLIEHVLFLVASIYVFLFGIENDLNNFLMLIPIILCIYHFTSLFRELFKYISYKLYKPMFSFSDQIDDLIDLLSELNFKDEVFVSNLLLLKNKNDFELVKPKLNLFIEIVSLYSVNRSNRSEIKDLITQLNEDLKRLFFKDQLEISELSKMQDNLIDIEMNTRIEALNNLFSKE